MNKKNRHSNHSTTEDVPDTDLHIDKLQTSVALSMMLDSQAAAIPALTAALPAIEAAATAAHVRLLANSAGRLIYAGAGTSARIGVQDGAELPPTFNWPKKRLAFLIAGGPSALLGAIENAEDDKEAGVADATKIKIGKHDVVIGLAASGQTPYTHGVILASQAAGALTIGIVNNPDTPLLNRCQLSYSLATGGEIIAGSTRLKAGTAQKFV